MLHTTAIAVFLRPPVPGEVKTRLSRTIGDERTCTLYRAFVYDTLTKVERLSNSRVGLFVAGECGHPALGPVLDPFTHTRVAQVEGGLGERMEAALRWCFSVGTQAILLGTDSPSIPLRYLRTAQQVLGRRNIVLGPTADGGYYLLGASRPHVPPLRSGIRYSTAHALSDTLRAVQGADLCSVLLPPWFDVDTGRDLRLLELELSLDPRRAPATAQVLGLPVQPTRCPNHETHGQATLTRSEVHR